MGLIFLLNGIGLVGSAAWMGLAIKSGYLPSWSIFAALLFFIGMVIPFLDEYGAVRQGFDRIERDFFSRTGTSFAPRGTVETFGPGRPPREPAWSERRHGPRRILAILLAAGIAVLAIDLVIYFTDHAPSQAQPGRITNL